MLWYVRYGAIVLDYLTCFIHACISFRMLWRSSSAVRRAASATSSSISCIVKSKNKKNRAWLLFGALCGGRGGSPQIKNSKSTYVVPPTYLYT